MYYALFILYIIVATIIGAWGFCWALKKGQFRDQQRARFLPLREEEDPQRADVNHHPHQPHGRPLALVIFWLLVTGVFVLYFWFKVIDD